MSDETTNESNAKGKEANTPVTEIQHNSGTGMADKAIEAAERLERANEETKKNLDRQEELMAKQALGGFSSAGKETLPKTQDEIDQETADAFLKEDDE